MDIPVFGKMFFNDFSSDLISYIVKRDSHLVGTFKGLSNNDKTGYYISFLLSDSPDIEAGDTLTTEDSLYSWEVTKLYGIIKRKN